MGDSRDTMEPSDLVNGCQTLKDVMYRRLKNRERQRRYRQRKRVRPDTNAHVTNQSSQMQIVSLPTKGTVEQFVTRVYCKRDWKKDARRVHAMNTEARSNDLSSSEQSLASENHLPHLSLALREEEQTSRNGAPENYPGPNDSEKVRIKHRRRDWKAEARNKK